MRSRMLKKAAYDEEIAKLEQTHELEDAATSSCFGRVVWKHSATIKTHTLDLVGLASDSKDFPSLRGIHVGDAEFWFNQLHEDYDRDSHAWEIEIYPIEGDFFTDDPQYKIPNESGIKGDSHILVTTRTTLKEGVDFDYGRELTADDLPSEERYDDDDGPAGYGGYSGFNLGMDADNED